LRSESVHLCSFYGRRPARGPLPFRGACSCRRPRCARSARHLASTVGR
jgi:hypothetical protein